MNDHSLHSPPVVRKLRKHDLHEIALHLLRLDRESRRLRFGALVSDEFIRTYAARVTDIDSVVFGAFFDGKLRAVGELRLQFKSWPLNADLAVSVEPGWQGQGIGSALFSRLVAAAQNRNIKSLHVLFQKENHPMRRIAAKHHPGLDFQGGQVEATFDAPWPTSLSIAQEIAEDTGAYVRQVLFLAPLGSTLSEAGIVS